jgi:tetratricopeptide (TPR) repeat protein
VGLGRALGAEGILAAITIFTIVLRRTRPWLLFGWTWYLVALLPVAGLVQVGSQARADRYAYVPLIGIFVAAVWEVASRLEAWERGPEGRKKAAPAVGAIAVLLLAMAGYRQVGDWKDGETLYSHALAVTRGNWLAANNLGTYWLAKNEPARALPFFEKAIQIRPDYEQAWFNQGVALIGLNRQPEAVRVFRRNLELEPGNTDGWVNLGLTYLDLGRLQDALIAYETALKQRPTDAMALTGATFARAFLGDAAGARAYLARLQQVDPERAKGLEPELARAPGWTR